MTSTATNQHEVSVQLSKLIGHIKCTTPAKNAFEKTLDAFLVDYCSKRYIKNMKPEMLDEYNHIIYRLSENSVVSINVETHENGVNIITKVHDGYSGFVSPNTLGILYRKRQTVNKKLDLGVPVTATGLLEQEWNKMPFDTMVAYRYISKQLSSAERGIDFTLSIGEMRDLLKRKKCYYSGMELSLSGASAATFDRKDSSIGYTRENTVICSAAVNSIKNKLLKSREETSGMTSQEVKKMLLSLAATL